MRYTPHGQQGAVLIVSLVMLALATLIGVSGMTSAHLQERIAGNQKQGTDAFMAAETGVAQVIQASREVNHWSDVDDLLDQLGGKGPHALPEGHAAQWLIPERPVANGSAMTVQVVGSVGNTAARRTLEITLDTGLGGPPPDGAYHCFGPACADRAEESFDLAGLRFDGRLWPLPDGDDGYTCDHGICPDDPPGTVEDAMPLPGLFVILEGADGEGQVPREVGHVSDQVQGQPAPILVSDGSSTGGGNPSGTTAEDWRDYVTQLISHPERRHVHFDGAPEGPLLNGEASGDGLVYVGDFIGSRDAPRIHHLEGEGSIGLNGHESGAGILVISDQVTLSPSYDTSVTFEGLVILMEGAQLDADQATVNIFGSVVSLAGDDASVFDDLTGDINIRYSPEALDNLRDHGLWDSALSHPRIIAWREIM